MSKEKTGVQQKKRGVFYGWWIVVTGIALSTRSGMTYSYGLSVFYSVLIDQFGWSRAQLAGAISLSRLEAGLLGGVEGFLVDRYGPRPLIVIGTLLTALGFVLLSRINSLLEFYLIFILMVAVGQALATQVPIDTTVANWFIRRRGTAFGLLRGAVAISAAGVILVAWFVSQYGWRTGFVVSGVMTLFVGIPAAFVMRSRPEHYGQLPDGAIKEEIVVATESGDSSAGSSVAVEEDIGMTVREALRCWDFWAISSAYAIRLAVTGAVTLHAIPLVIDMGYSPAAAAGVLGSIGVVSLIGRLGGGALNDIIGTKRVAVGCIFSLALSFLILTQAQNLWHIYLFVAVYAPSYGASAATLPAIKGDYFGRRSFGTILGLSGILQTGGSMFGPVFAGYVYDVTNSYRLAFFIFAGLLMISAALFMSLKKPRYSGRS